MPQLQHVFLLLRDLQMPEQEDSLRWHPAVLLAVFQRWIRMQDERQVEQEGVPERIHRVVGGEGACAGG